MNYSFILLYMSSQELDSFVTGMIALIVIVIVGSIFFKPTGTEDPSEPHDYGDYEDGDDLDQYRY